MLKIYTQELYAFRVIDSNWLCVDPQKYSGTLADFLRNFGFDYLPDGLEFARVRLGDNGFSAWIYNDALCVKFKIFNKPSNFKFL